MTQEDLADFDFNYMKNLQSHSIVQLGGDKHLHFSLEVQLLPSSASSCSPLV